MIKSLTLVPGVERIPAGYRMYGQLYENEASIHTAYEDFGIMRDPEHRHTVHAYKQAVSDSINFATKHNENCNCNVTMEVRKEV